MGRRNPQDKQGSQGTPIPLLSNYLKLICLNEAVYQYAVSFSPDIDSKNMRFALISEHKSEIGETKAFDGCILYLPVNIGNVKLTSRRVMDGTEIIITVQFVKQLSPDSHHCIPFYNIVFRRVMRILQMKLVGKSYFDPHHPFVIPQHRLQIWPGYVMNVKKVDGGMLLMMDIAHKVLRMDSVLEVMQDLYNHKGYETFRDECMRQLVGVIVVTRYNNRTYRIDDIAWDKTPRSTFLSHDGSISFADYYKNHYNLEIGDMDQPLLMHRPKKKVIPVGQDQPDAICLVPEFSSMTGISDKMRSDFSLMKAVSEYTRLTPIQRKASLEKFVQNVMHTPDAKKELQQWGLEIDPAFFQTVGRAQMGIMIAEPQYVEQQNDRTETFIRNISGSFSPSVQMVMCIFPSMRDDRYNAVKRLCCVEQPVPSQVVLTRTISNPKRVRSVAQKVVLQMNCKMGGVLWSVNIPLKSLMIVGMDVFHDTTKRMCSVAGVVASLNSSGTQWFSRIIKHATPTELIDGLKFCFIDAIKSYHGINNELPAKIVVYRDGVSEGQLQVVENYEVQQIYHSFASFGEHYMPQVVVIVVQKRINTTICLNRGIPENPPSGTVLDHGVTNPNWYDFFLVSQHVRQGTVSPTHYVVLHNTTKLSPDHLQRLTYKMTHMYYNWPGTIRVPAPCKYAHKLAFLVGQSLHEAPAPELGNKLFFL
uniref:piwi-like protein 2 n=1 Tax=Myxine glutinosa TaxID=7769 RepID=UPI00358E54D2